MRVLIVGSTGCIGSAVAQALRMRGHTVVTGARSAKDGDRSMHVDYMRPRTPEAWAERLRDARIDAVVNAAGMWGSELGAMALAWGRALRDRRGIVPAGRRRARQRGAVLDRAGDAQGRSPGLRTRRPADDSGPARRPAQSPR